MLLRYTPSMLPKKYRIFKRYLAVKKSSAGFGLFTRAPIKRGEFMVEYRGPVLSLKEANEKGGKYLFETSSNRYVDGTNRSNIARYINHACRPNAYVEVRRGRILVFAKRAIAAGEELTYDYDKEYVDSYIKPFGCRCTDCREA